MELVYRLTGQGGTCRSVAGGIAEKGDDLALILNDHGTVLVSANERTGGLRSGPTLTVELGIALPLSDVTHCRN
jgi:hypothetical protein